MFGRLSLKDGIPIGKIEGGRYHDKTIKISQTDLKHDDNEYIIKDDGKIRPLWHTQINGHPNRLDIAGASLCGKSYYASQIAKDYLKQNPKNRIALFSAIKEDDNYEDFPKKKLLKINCDDKLLDNPISMEQCKNTMCIFDDIDSFSNKKISKHLNEFRDDLMCTGRHHNIDVLSLSQTLLDGHKSKKTLTNAFQIIAFPHSGGRYQLSEYLKRKMSLDKPTIMKIINLPSRWVVINTSPPLYVMHQKGAFLI